MQSMKMDKYPLSTRSVRPLACRAVMALGMAAALMGPLSFAHATVQSAPAKAPEKAAPAKAAAQPRVAASAVSVAKAVAPAGALAARAPIADAAPPAHVSPVPLISGAHAFCDEVIRKLPNVSKGVCTRAEVASAGTARSAKGRPLFQRDVISDNAHLRVLVIGGIHGDELSSTALVLHWIGAAMETPSNIHWRFVPLVNPDGMLQPKPTRVNANGVDLNRNFPTPNWDKEAPFYWNKRTAKDPRRYPGPRPLSEPESKWLHDEMERWKPNLIVSVHAPYGVLDFDGPVVPPQRLGRLYLDQVGIFPGSLGNYGGVHKKVPVVTIELPSALRTPQEAEIRQMWLDLLRWTAERLGAG
ncbi:MAG: M14 family murein peptide amidase A [Aquabacterium sp.]